MTAQEKDDADSYCGFCVQVGVPRSVIEHLSRRGMEHYTPESREYIVAFAMKHLPLASALQYRVYPL
jgi:hypothetical protein